MTLRMQINDFMVVTDAQPQNVVGLILTHFMFAEPGDRLERDLAGQAWKDEHPTHILLPQQTFGPPACCDHSAQPATVTATAVTAVEATDRVVGPVPNYRAFVLDHTVSYGIPVTCRSRPARLRE